MLQGSDEPQLPWEPPVRPTWFTRDSVTPDPWLDHRAAAPSSWGKM